MAENGVQTVVILGLARQGKALARYWVQRGAQVIVSDKRPAEALQADIASLGDLPIRYVLGGHPLELLDGCDLLCLSGGIPLDLPIVEEARRRGIPLSSDAQEFLRVCPAPVVGITGSAGKTTTTALTGALIRAAGFTTWVGGNIGNPLLDDLPAIQPTDRVVMELSSFQLDLMTLSPAIAAVLNITPNHLDRHKTMEAYIAAKANIVRHQRPGDWAILGYDEPNARGLSALTPARVAYFSLHHGPDVGTFLRGDVLLARWNDREGEICRRVDVPLRGAHNLQNVLAASALALAAGAPLEGLREVIRTFEGVPHRLEVVRRWRDVTWINDSIATAPERVLAALRAFDEPLVLLAGGRDKQLPWADFALEAARRVRVIITFGEAGDLIAGHLRQALATLGPQAALETLQRVATLDEAVQLAAQWARPGEVVLLSPGGTSFDAFQDFAARGEHFRALVLNLD